VSTTADQEQPANTDAPRRSGLPGLYDRFRHQIHEVGKFGVVGLVSFVVDTVVFNVLLARHLEALTSATISMIIAATVAFIGNRFWTWRDRERTSLKREYGLYFLFNAIGLLIALACLAISTYGLGAVWPVFQTTLAKNISKQIVGTALGTLFRFWSYRTIVFRNQK
jgi:putative flippase GtrA